MARREAVLKRAREVCRTLGSADIWVELYGRFGYTVKGLLYMLVGALAALTALGFVDATTGQRGALRQIARLPYGRFLLVAAAIGFAGYTLWRFVQALLDTECKGAGAKGIAARFFYVGIGFVYAGLALSATRIAIGAPRGESDAAQSWTAWLLAQPFGRWLVGLIGACVIGLGLYQIYRAYSAKFREKLTEISRAEEMWAVRVGRLGISARGIVFCITGGFLILAAVESDANESLGLDGALQVLAGQTFGRWLLGLVAAGLVAYGIHSLVLAKYRRMIVM